MRVVCPGCSAKLKATPRLFGKVLKCPKCSHAIQVPTSDEGDNGSRLSSAAPKRRVSVACSACNGKVRIPESKVGTTAKCPHCGAMASFNLPVAPAVVSQVTPPIENSISTPSSAAAGHAENVKQTSASSEKPSGGSGLRIAAFVGAILTVGTLIGVAAFLLRPSDDDNRNANRNESSNISAVASSNSTATPVDTKSEVDVSSAKPNADPIVNEPNAPAYPPIKFDFGGLQSLTGYKASIKYQKGDEKPIVTNGHLIYETISGESRTRRKNSSRRLPTTEILTGLGIPGNRVLVPWSMTQSPEKIEIEYDGKKYSAEAIEEFRKEGFTVLDFEGPDFPPPKTFKVDEFYGRVNALRVETGGDVDAIVEVEGGSNPFGNMPKTWQSSVLYKHWGTVAGLMYRENKRARVIKLSTILEHIDAEAFEFVSPNATSIDEVVANAKKNLVKVTVERPPEEGETIFLASQYSFDPLPDESTANSNSRRIPGQSSRSRKSIKFPSFDMRRQSELRKLELLPSGNFAYNKSNRQNWFPPGILSIEESVVFELQPGSKAWQQEIQYFAPHGKIKSGYSHAGTGISKKPPYDESGKIVRLIIQNEITEEDDNSAKVTRVFAIEPHLPKEEVPESNSTSSETTEFEFEAVQQIAFDKVSGKVVKSLLTGNVAMDGFKANFEFAFDLLNSKQTKAILRKKDLHDESAKRAADIDLKPNVIPKLAAGLKSEQKRERQDTVSWLNGFRPKPNKEISRALAVDFAENFENSREAWQACRNWVLPEQVPDILLSYKDQYDSDPTALMELLMVRPRIPESYLPDLTKIAAASFKSPATSCVLISKYPDLLEPACIEYLSSINGKFHKGEAALKLLKDYGTAASLETLEALAERIGTQKVRKRQRELTMEAIEQIKLRESDK